MGLPLKELVKIGETQLADAGVDDAARDAKLLYCFLDNLDSVGFIMRWQDVLPDNTCERYFELVERRAFGEPLQYITGSQEFMGFSFKVDPSVLIPRQDTETMVEDAVELIEKGTLRGEEYTKSQAIREVLDLCCGSGAIGVSIAKLCGKVKVTCSDVSGEAVSMASKNAKINGCKAIKFEKSDMFSAFKSKLGKKKFDLIISNPPYIESEVIPTLQREVKEHEPMIALDGGPDGLEFYRRIAVEAADHLHKNGVLMLEIGYNQGQAVKKLLEKEEKFISTVCLKDLAGKDRLIVARLKDKKL